MIYAIIAVVLIGIAVFVYFRMQAAKKKALNIKYNETVLIADLLSEYQSMTDALGKGMYTRIAEVKGEATGDRTTEAALSKKAVVWFESKVEREYEVEQERTDSEGNKTREWVKRTETVSDQNYSEPFYVSDQSGEKVLIDPKGSDLDSIETFDQYEREAPSGFSFNIGNATGSKTLGYRMTERSIPVGQRLYILGEAHDRNSELSIGKSNDKEQSFIVSVKSEDEILASLKWAGK